MPHVSKQKVNPKTREEMDAKLVSLLADSSSATRKRVLQELLTNTEKTMLVKRLAIIYLVERGVATHRISTMLRVSPSTVARYEVKTTKGAYRNTLRWVRTTRIGRPIWQLLEKVAAIPFDAQKKSLAQLSKDW